MNFLKDYKGVIFMYLALTIICAFWVVNYDRNDSNKVVSKSEVIAKNY